LLRVVLYRLRDTAHAPVNYVAVRIEKKLFSPRMWLCLRRSDHNVSK